MGYVADHGRDIANLRRAEADDDGIERRQLLPRERLHLTPCHIRSDARPAVGAGDLIELGDAFQAQQHRRIENVLVTKYTELGAARDDHGTGALRLERE